MLLLRRLYLIAICYFLCLCPSIYSSLEDDEQELIEDNFDNWMQQYFNWLAEEQKDELREMKEEGYTIDDYIAPLNDMYDALKGEALGKATEAVNRGCLAFIDYLTAPSKLYLTEFENIARTGYDPYTDANNKAFVDITRKRLTETADGLISEIKNGRKRKLGKKILPSCVKVFLSSTYMIRYYNDKLKREKYLVNDSDIENWSEQYLNWLSESEKVKLKALAEKGASLHELRVAIGDFYVGAYGDRKTEATKSLFEGCSVFAEYLLGKKKAADYIEFIKEAATTRQKSFAKPTGSKVAEKEYQEKLHSESKALLDGMPSGFKHDVARNFFVSCLGIFDAIYRTNEHILQDHDEI